MAYPAPTMRDLRAADMVLRPTESTRMLLAPALEEKQPVEARRASLLVGDGLDTLIW